MTSRKIKQVDFAEGVRTLVQLGNPLIGRVGVIPWKEKILVGVYGLPNAGKTCLIDEVVYQLKIRGIEAGGEGSAPSESSFEQFVGWEHAYCNYLLFHCAWERFPERRCFNEEDPNILAQRVLDRGLNMNVGIYNSQRRRRIEGTYDLCIRNPDSRIKAQNKPC